jgi:hypothetical protein
MRYRIEYLANNADRHSVCHIKDVADLTEAERQAWTGASGAGRLFGAHGFQIRDSLEGGQIVSTGRFDVTG